jgi:two-component system sensor histidine kinase/response regulator
MAGKKVYIAEDFPMQIELLKALFEGDERFETTFFNDGLELYLQVQKEPPEVLILDIILPNLSGMAITRLLKFDDRHSSIPIIVTSSITDPAIKDRVGKVGGDYFLQKPFLAQDLLDNLLKT